MTLPRALTWLHLLPRDAEYACASGPAWLREALAGISVPGGRGIVVACDRGAGDLDLDNAAAFAGINCAGLDVRWLRTAGFSGITRLAVLPSLDEPRWFIPLGFPAVSAAAFNLYSPTRLMARLRRTAAQMAVHARLPFWYRDQILIAQRGPSPLQRRLENLFSREDIYLALSSGAPEGARNRKASAAVMDKRGRILAYLKLAGSGLSESLLRNEARVLRSLEGRGIPAPRLIEADRIDGTFVTAQSPLPGRPDSSTLTAAHMRFLDGLRFGPGMPLHDTDLIRSLNERIAASPEHRTELMAGLEIAMAGPADAPPGVAVLHGDFAPWNLRLRGGEVSAFDWEYGRLSGPAGLDEIHYRIQTGYLLRRWSVDRATHELRDVSRPLLILYCVDMLARLFCEGYDQTNEMLAWTRRLLSRLTASAPREVALA